MTRVALVHDWLTGMRGGEKVLAEIASLVPEAPIFTLFHFPGSVSRELEAHPIHTSMLQHAPGIRNHYRKLLPFFPQAVGELDLSSFDLVISSSHCVAKSVRRAPGAFHVCYCHTPMRYVWDQRPVYFPSTRSPIDALRDLVLTELRRWDAATADRVDLYVANSSFVAERITNYYGRRAEVVHPPVDVEAFPLKTADDEGYCLVVSALAPYKRLEVAIEACERAGRELRIVGDGPERRRLASLAGERTRFLGRLEQAELVEVYQRASLFLQPGVEDFGIAAVEALAVGTPVIAVDRGGVRDIVDNGVHGLLYGPPSAGAEVDALAAIIDKSRQIRFNSLEMRGRAETFSAGRFREQFGSLLARRPSLEGAN